MHFAGCLEFCRSDLKIVDCLPKAPGSSLSNMGREHCNLAAKRVDRGLQVYSDASAFLSWRTTAVAPSLLQAQLALSAPEQAAASSRAPVAANPPLGQIGTAASSADPPTLAAAAAAAAAAGRRHEQQPSAGRA